jgi:hypothetical protein
MSATTTKPISFKRPLVSLWTVLSVTDLKSEDDVLAAIDDGRLLFAFNIAGKTSKSRLVRVLAASLCNFVEGTRFPKMLFEEEWKHVERLIFPVPGLRTMASKDIALAWNISGTHILSLCDEGLLRIAKGSPRHCGNGGSPQIEYQSAVQFLRDRRIC